MGVVKRMQIWSVVLGTYLLCYIFRTLEYFVLRTDQTWVGEAIVHKVLGIVILFGVSACVKITVTQMGFVKEKAFCNLVKGLAFGCSVFVLAYGVEIMIAASQGSFSSLQLYVSTYAIDQNTGYRTESMFFLICIIGNVVNVVTEEGLFRGLFAKLLEGKYSFVISAVISSCLFGFWHMVGPVRSYVDGIMSMSGMVANIAMLVGTSALVGFKFAMLTKMTGSLYMAMGDHFVNNTIVNLLLVVSDTGVDERMVVRVAIAQSVSFICVLVCYIRRCRENSIKD
jgi:membrane protease YdiL (CAAX protease family)